MAKNGFFYKVGKAIANLSGNRGFDTSPEIGGPHQKEEILEEGKELAQCFYCGDATTTYCSVCGKSVCIRHRRELPDFTNRSRGTAPFCTDCASTAKLPSGSRPPKPGINLNKKAISNIICCVVATLIMTLSWFFL